MGPYMVAEVTCARSRPWPWAETVHCLMPLHLCSLKFQAISAIIPTSFIYNSYVTPKISVVTLPSCASGWHPVGSSLLSPARLTTQRPRGEGCLPKARQCPELLPSWKRLSWNLSFAESAFIAQFSPDSSRTGTER